jgi:hypothetical protein
MMRFRLDGVDQIGKFHRILNEEYGYVIADQIPVAFVSVELHCKSAGVTCSVFRTAFAGNGGKSLERRGYFAFFGEWRRPRNPAFKVF